MKYVCQICGYVHEGENAPEACPQCKAPAGKFTLQNDNNGEINLGNVFENELESIINSQKALNIYNGFSNRKACEELCKKCTFANKNKNG